MNLIDEFEKLTIEQIKEIIIKIVEDNKKLREKLAIYQEDIKHKEEPHTAQDFVDWASEENNKNVKN